MTREVGGAVLLTVTLALTLSLASLAAGSKVEVVTREIKDPEEAERVELNEVLQANETDYSKDHPHALQGKPSRFDLDATQLIQVDAKSPSEEDAKSPSTEHPIAPDSPKDSKDISSWCEVNFTSKCLEDYFEEVVDGLAKLDTYNLTGYVQILKTGNGTQGGDRPETFLDKVERYAREHILRIQIPKELLSPRKARTFGAFGLKKLLLPLIIGAQIIKSVLIALFLPSIIGSIGKIVGKSVSSFAQSSQGVTAQPEETFEFKDNSDLYNEDYMTRQPLGTLPAAAMYDETMASNQKNQEIASRLSYVDHRISHMNGLSDRYYNRPSSSAMHHSFTKKQDFKVFHEIPSSSLLLTNYDPFYSPLLSRLDAVFSRLGHTTEPCREYAVCAMYRSPARYAPYSNLVSAQLSRELNELRKPSSDNPDVLRFFRYMKAAKDGQDGLNCEDMYSGCDLPREDHSFRQNQAMLATYQDIDKLVHARKL